MPRGLKAKSAVMHHGSLDSRCFERVPVTNLSALFPATNLLHCSGVDEGATQAKTVAGNFLN